MNWHTNRTHVRVKLSIYAGPEEMLLMGDSGAEVPACHYFSHLAPSKPSLYVPIRQAVFQSRSSRYRHQLRQCYLPIPTRAACGK